MRCEVSCVRPGIGRIVWETQTTAVEIDGELTMQSIAESVPYLQPQGSMMVSPKAAAMPRYNSVQASLRSEHHKDKGLGQELMRADPDRRWREVERGLAKVLVFG